MKIAVIGAGGVGGYFGARLVKAGNDVTFLARGEHLEALKKNGLFVKSILGDFHADQFVATDIIAEIENPDLVILGVKAWQVEDILADLKKIIHPDSMILPLQNGVTVAEELAEVIDSSCILGGMCRIFSKIESPGVINHFGITPEIIFGELDQEPSSRLRDLKQAFDIAGIESHISPDIQADLWKKFIVICVSGLLAVTHTSYGELREQKETREMMISLLNEIYRVSRAAGINLSSDIVDKTIEFIDTFPYDSVSSLTRDVWEGKPSEIEYQNGTVVRLGEKYGVDTPVNNFIYHCILPGELKARNLFPSSKPEDR